MQVVAGLSKMVSSHSDNTEFSDFGKISGEFPVIVFGPIHKNNNSEFIYGRWNHAWK